MNIFFKNRFFSIMLFALILCIGNAKADVTYRICQSIIGDEESFRELLKQYGKEYSKLFTLIIDDQSETFKIPQLSHQPSLKNAKIGGNSLIITYHRPSFTGGTKDLKDLWQIKKQAEATKDGSESWVAEIERDENYKTMSFTVKKIKIGLVCKITDANGRFKVLEPKDGELYEVPLN